jgi:hypothetical protein
MESKLVFLLSFLLLLFVFSCGLAAWSTILDAPDRFDEKIGFIGYGLMVMTAAVSMIVGLLWPALRVNDVFGTLAITLAGLGFIFILNRLCAFLDRNSRDSVEY